MNKTALIIGGTSGLGLELARFLVAEYTVIVTGRRDPDEPTVTFKYLELDSDKLCEHLDSFVAELPDITLVVYAAGFYQEGTMSDLNDADIVKMNRVGLLAPSFLAQRILKKQGEIPILIAITSTSGWTPRLLEPMYTAVKGGLAMLSNSLSLDERIGKVLVVGPSGMQTRFWKEDGRNVDEMLDPAWVAKEIHTLLQGQYQYKFARILRNPSRVEMVEVRK